MERLWEVPRRIWCQDLDLQGLFELLPQSAEEKETWTGPYCANNGHRPFRGNKWPISADETSLWQNQPSGVDWQCNHTSVAWRNVIRGNRCDYWHLSQERLIYLPPLSNILRYWKYTSWPWPLSISCSTKNMTLTWFYHLMYWMRQGWWRNSKSHTLIWYLSHGAWQSQYSYLFVQW